MSSASADADAAKRPAYWQSEGCLQKLERSFVSLACMERWAELPPLPTEDGVEPRLQTQMRLTRQFYMALLQRGDPNTFHNSWSKACAVFDSAMHALVAKKSLLLQDPVIIATVCVGLMRKEEMSAATGCWSDLLRVAMLYEDQLGVQRQVRTEKALRMAEFEILQALDWALPTTETYTCISGMLLRADILTQGEHKPQLEAMWTHAVHMSSWAVLHGQANGYRTARQIVAHVMEKYLASADVSPDFLKKLLEEAAPVALEK